MINKSYLKFVAREKTIRRILKSILGVSMGGKEVIEHFKIHARIKSTNPIAPLSVSAPGKGQHILVLIPHPDDEVIGAGGTLVLAAASGCEVTCYYATSGAFFSDDMTYSETGALRQSEASAVCALAGWNAIFDDRQCSGKLSDPDQLLRLARIVKELEPSHIFIPFILDEHEDHRDVNRLLAMTRGRFNEAKITVWAFPVWTELIPNIGVEITSVRHLKQTLASTYKSQEQIISISHMAVSQSAYNFRYFLTKEPSWWEVYYKIPLTEYLDLLDGFFGRFD
jgi:LmbE family N-acetylglucosaminyl deacetylase